MKNLLLLALLVPIAVSATQRVMVIEDVTATWCTYCPGAARGAEELKFRAFDSVVVIAYHASSSDPFYTANSAARLSYYSISGYPTVVLDGSNKIVGGLHTGTMYPTYRAYFDTRKLVASPLEIDLSVSYDSTSRNGQLNVTLRNTSTGSVSGTLQVVLVESHIYYPWQGMDSLQDVERNMLPDASGEAVTVAAGDSLKKTRSFAINPAWVARNCEFVVFVQNSSSKEIFQGTTGAVIPSPSLEYVGYQPVLPAPGGASNLTVGLRNVGTGGATGISAVLSTSDPDVTVTTPNASFADIPLGHDGYSSSPFAIQVSSGCPDPHLATMNLAITSTGDVVKNTSFPLNIATNTGFLDNMEYGDHGWTHSGIRDGWHLTTHRNSSPTHSWYCGIEGSWAYSDENDARLGSPLFTAGEATAMRFEHYYRTEATYDFCVVEAGNGSLFWTPLAQYDGSSSGWQQVNLDLAHFQKQTVQVRFRFISDSNTTDEGWYVDDFWCSPLTGAEEERPVRLNTQSGPNPVRAHAEISYQVPAGRTAGLAIYDAGGRLVRALGSGLAGSGRIGWNLADDSGTRVAGGAYFARLVSGNETSVSKLVVNR